MVDRVIGKADDFELIFDRTEGGHWQPVAPSNLYGDYPVEIWAYDTAGNISYLATMLYIISKKTLRGYLIPYEYIGTISSDELIAKLDTCELKAVLKELDTLKGGTGDGITKT